MDISVYSIYKKITQSSFFGVQYRSTGGSPSANGPLSVGNNDAYKTTTHHNTAPCHANNVTCRQCITAINV